MAERDHYGHVKPVLGRWRIWKHRETGELLGPSVDFGVPADPVWAFRVDGGWKEVPAGH